MFIAEDAGEEPLHQFERALEVVVDELRDSARERLPCARLGDGDVAGRDEDLPADAYLARLDLRCDCVKIEDLLLAHALISDATFVCRRNGFTSPSGASRSSVTSHEMSAALSIDQSPVVLTLLRRQ